MRERIYICGMMSGDPCFRAKFAEAERELKRKGFRPANPAKGVSGGEGRRLREGLKKLAGCGAICLLPDWERSEWARLELAAARKLGMEVWLAVGNGRLLFKEAGIS